MELYINFVNGEISIKKIGLFTMKTKKQRNLWLFWGNFNGTVQ